ncbi:hypothetical protein Tco_0540355 [Tanacetum coccineum]
MLGTGLGILWVDPLDAVPEIAPYDVGRGHTRVTQLQLQSTLIQTQHQVHETRFHMQQTELAALRETHRRRQDQMVETLRVIRDMRQEMSDMQAELLALREQRRRARQSGLEARVPDH